MLSIMVTVYTNEESNTSEVTLSAPDPHAESWSRVAVEAEEAAAVHQLHAGPHTSHPLARTTRESYV